MTMRRQTIEPIIGRVQVDHRLNSRSFKGDRGRQPARDALRVRCQSALAAEDDQPEGHWPVGACRAQLVWSVLS